jgi:hypothetical protein
LEGHRSDRDAGEFVIWVKIGLFHPILYVPGFVVKFGVHPDTNTFKPSIILGLIHPRIRFDEEAIHRQRKVPMPHSALAT